MENLNKIENLPVADALVKETPIVEPKAVEPESPAAPIESAKPEPVLSESVILYSIKDIVTESGVSIAKGYSRVNNKDAEQLLQYNNVRKASVEEIETYFNK